VSKVIAVCLPFYRWCFSRKFEIFLSLSQVDHGSQAHHFNRVTIKKNKEAYFVNVITKEKKVILSKVFGLFTRHTFKSKVSQFGYNISISEDVYSLILCFWLTLVKQTRNFNLLL
jgi:hypothetical protein